MISEICDALKCDFIVHQLFRRPAYSFISLTIVHDFYRTVYLLCYMIEILGI